MNTYLYVGIGVAVLILFWFISTTNKFRRLQVKIDEAESGIDVALTKRYDVLTKMFNTAKGYAKHEMETLTNVVKYRKGMSIDEMSEANAQMNKAFGQINALAESYPDLKASTNFANLQMSITETEEHLQAARRVYNSNVSIYNQMIVTFPNSIIANSKGFQKRSFFQADEAKRQDVNMEF